LLDILVRGGLIVDGTGSPPYLGDVAISGGRIVALGCLEGATAAMVIAADGQAVAPGFIDMHSHSDLSLPRHPKAGSSLSQGITTEVAGSCGWSLAPVKKETAGSVLRGLCEGLMGEVPGGLDEESNGGAPGLGWYSFAQYLEHIENQGMGVNLYPIVGQSLLRAHVVGTDRRPATPGEIRAMQELLLACLAEGARGLSAGRAYLPGAGASIEEIIALAKVVAASGGLYTSHLKDESSGVVDAVAEAIRIGRESGVRVEVSHHKAIGRANFGRVAETLAMMEDARRSGVDVTCDVYPYNFAQVFSLLTELPGISASQPDDEVRVLLAQEEFRQKTAARLLKACANENGAPGFLSRPEHIGLVSLGASPELEGQPLASVMGSVSLFPDALSAPSSQAVGAPDPATVRTLVDRLLDFLLAQDLRVNLAAIMAEEDVVAVLGQAETMVGTDAFTLDRELGDRTPIHPRHYGTFPRVLGHYGRDKGLGGLAPMVRKVSGLPARKLRLADRGLLQRGMAADLVVFDPGTIADRATAKSPYLEPIGIGWVIVNGRVAAKDGRPTDARAGMVLRR
jgi:N-acyl-D-amino-acid deacylase